MNFDGKIFSIAPMMEWTDKHCRFFHRQITSHARLYTEMVTADAIIHGDRAHLLGYNESEQPVALQLGGSDPAGLKQATKIADDYNYDEYNLNIGCPSDRVQSGRFGACLMQEPELVRDCISAMQEATQKPVTVKCRIGVDEMDDDEGLEHFVNVVRTAGTKTFIIHARKAWLKGLSPKQNREVPPLNYQRVYRLKQQFPDLSIIINGGIETLAQTKQHLSHVDGVMMGRAAYQTPYILADLDKQLFDKAAPVQTRQQIITKMIPYIEESLKQGTRLHQITRHMLGLYHREPGARTYRRILSTKANQEGAGVEVLLEASEATENASFKQTTELA